MQSFGRTGLGLFRVPFFTIDGEGRVVEVYIHTHIYIHRYACIFMYKYKFQGKRQICKEQGSDYSCVPHHQAVINQDQAPQLLGRMYFSKASCSHSENYCCEHPFSHLISVRQRGAGSQDEWTSPAVLAPCPSHLCFFLQLHCKCDPSCCGQVTAVLHRAPAALSMVPCQFLPWVTSLLHLTCQLVWRKGYMHVSAQGWWWDRKGSIS